MMKKTEATESLSEIEAIVSNSNDAQSQVIIKIIKDDIIFCRVEDLMYQISKVFAPAKRECYNWEAFEKYSGYTVAFEILGITEEDNLCGILSDLNFDMKYQNEQPADELAKQIYFKWLIEIKNYYTKQKSA